MVVALGFALQESLGDLASGVMLAFFRPYKMGDEVNNLAFISNGL